MARLGRPKGTKSLLERLLDRVVINEVTDCWEYQGGKNNIGYGMIRDEKKMRTTHRVSYEEHVGKIPPRMCVCHTCDNPICCNPNHLWLGTLKQNSHDMYKKGRGKPFGSYLGSGDGMRGKKQPTTLCVHCNRLMPNNSYARFHGEKCRSKQVE
jgi:hypothetical protein